MHFYSGCGVIAAAKIVIGWVTRVFVCLFVCLFVCFLFGIRKQARKKQWNLLMFNYLEWIRRQESPQCNKQKVSLTLFFNLSTLSQWQHWEGEKIRTYQPSAVCSGSTKICLIHHEWVFPLSWMNWHTEWRRSDVRRGKSKQTINKQLRGGSVSDNERIKEKKRKQVDT